MLGKPYFNFLQPSGTRLRYSRDPYGFGDPWEVCCAKRDDTENPEVIDRRGQRRSLHPPPALLPGLATTSRVVCTFGRFCAISTRRWLSLCGAHQDFWAGLLAGAGPQERDNLAFRPRLGGTAWPVVCAGQFVNKSSNRRLRFITLN